MKSQHLQLMLKTPNIIETSQTTFAYSWKSLNLQPTDNSIVNYKTFGCNRVWINNWTGSRKHYIFSCTRSSSSILTHTRHWWLQCRSTKTATFTFKCPNQSCRVRRLNWKIRLSARIVNPSHETELLNFTQ